MTTSTDTPPTDTTPAPAPAPGTTARWRIEIDQSAITAPAFPRDVAWWRGWLPVWYSKPRWWTLPESEWINSGVTIETTTGAVIVRPESHRHAQSIMKHLLGGPLPRHMTDPDRHIRLVDTK